MTLPEGPTSLSPLAIGIGLPITDLLFEILLRFQQWVLRFRPEIILSLCVGDAGWDDYAGGDGNAIGIMEAHPGDVQETLICLPTSVRREQVAHGTVAFGAECDVGLATEVEISLTLTGPLGTKTSTITCTNLDNGTEVETIGITWGGVANDAADVEVEIAMQRSLGVGATELRTVRVEHEALGALPAPAND